MFLSTILFLLFVVSSSINIFSAENLVITIVGFLATTHLTEWIKNQQGLQGVGALLLAVVISILVAFVGLVISVFLNEGSLTFEKFAAASVQIFSLATLAYKLFVADKK